MTHALLTPVPPDRSRRRRARLAVGAYVAVFALGVVLLPAGQPPAHWWSDTFWTVAALAGAVQCFLAARDTLGRTRTAWQLFGAGCVAWLLGMLVWTYYELAGQLTPFPALSDLGFLGLAPLFSAGLMYYGNTRRDVSFALLDVSQLGIFVSCIVIVHIIAFYPLIVTPIQPPGYTLTSLAYPVLYMSLLVQAIAALWLHPPGPARRVLLYIALGIAVHAVANSLYAYALLGHVYEPGRVLDIAWVAGFGLIFYGAVEQRASAATPVASDPATLPSTLKAASAIPFLSLLLTVFFILMFRHHMTASMAVHLLPAGIALVLFISLRDWAGSALHAKLHRALRRSERHLNALTQLAPVGIFSTDADGNCIYVNDQWCDITGLTMEQAKGSGWIAALHPDDAPSILAAWKETQRSNRPFHEEYRMIHTDGTVRWVVGQTGEKLEEHDGIPGYVGTITDITARKHAEQALSESERRFRRLFEAAPVIASITRLADGTFLDINAAFEKATGWKREDILGRTALDLGLWSSPAHRRQVVDKLKELGSLWGQDWEVHTKSGATLNVLGSMEYVDIAGEPCAITVAQDITGRKRAEAAMAKLSSAIEQTADTVMITDREGVIEYVNPAFTAVTGYHSAEAVGQRPSIIRSGRQGQAFYENLWKTIHKGDAFSDIFINRKKSGALYYEQKTISPLRDAQGAITHFVATGRDITDRMETQARLEFMAHHDVLTELPNRALFLDRLKQALARARWHQRLVVVMFLDIDRFKNINDTLGHDIGDQLLRDLAVRLKDCLREGDTVARFGGDEFIVLLDDIANVADVAALARKILDSLKRPFLLVNSEMHMTASVGISLYPNDADEAGTLLSNADTAMYRAKDLGRNTYQFYSADMSARVFERLTLENHLRRALDNKEFALYYQPQFDVETDSVFGVEALLRWQSPDLGVVLPDNFVPLLEDTGLIVPIGLWVLETACEQLHRWHQEGWQELKMSVNLSCRQFAAPDLVESVERILRHHSIPPQCLELEITESLLMSHNLGAGRALESLHALGVRLGLDDFGTGYSSLSYLRRFPIDTLKIDRSFVMDIPEDRDDVEITRAIIAMGRSLKLEPVAEGVETEAQRDFLASLGCTRMQGFLFSEALPADTIKQLLTDRFVKQQLD